MMVEMFGGMFLMMLMAYSVVPLFPFVYVLLRWRQAREGVSPDPQLGLRLALYYFATIGLHVMLVGVVTGLYGLVVDGPRESESMMRVGAGLLIGGGIVFGVHRVLIARLTDPATGGNLARAFAGLNVVLCGLIGMGALIAATVMLTQESVPEEGFKVSAVTMVVYLAAWAGQGLALIRMSSLSSVSSVEV